MLVRIAMVMDRTKELRMVMVPADDPGNVDGGLQGGVWGTGWCGAYSPGLNL